MPLLPGAIKDVQAGGSSCCQCSCRRDEEDDTKQAERTHDEMKDMTAKVRVEGKRQRVVKMGNEDMLKVFLSSVVNASRSCHESSQGRSTHHKHSSSTFARRLHSHTHQRAIQTTVGEREPTFDTSQQSSFSFQMHRPPHFHCPSVHLRLVSFLISPSSPAHCPLSFA